MSTVLLVAAREVRERARARAWQASTALMLLVAVALVVLPTVFAGEGGEPRRLGVTGPTPPGLARALSGEDLQVRTFAERAAGEAAVRNGDVDALLVDGRTLEWKQDADPSLAVAVSGALQKVRANERAGALGLSERQVAELLAPPPLDTRSLGAARPGAEGHEGAAFAALVGLFIGITTYGTAVLTGVVEEKSSRIVELLLARMPARRLLAGKVLGIGALGLCQLLLAASAALVAALAIGALDWPAVPAALAGQLVLWFGLGYAFYAVGYGALGALASRMEDAQGASAPMTGVLLAAYMGSFVVLDSPDALAARIATFVPLTAPLVVPVRVALGAIPAWQQVLAVLVMLVATYGLVRLGGRVYTGAVLRVGARVRLREAWRAGADR